MVAVTLLNSNVKQHTHWPIGRSASAHGSVAVDGFLPPLTDTDPYTGRYTHTTRCHIFSAGSELNTTIAAAGAGQFLARSYRPYHCWWCRSHTPTLLCTGGYMDGQRHVDRLVITTTATTTTTTKTMYVRRESYGTWRAAAASNFAAGCLICRA